MIRKWFKPVSIYDLAFSLQRITGLVLVLYLCLHLTFLSTLSEREVYESLIKITASPEFKLPDYLLFLAGIYHGVNGFRIIIHELGYLHEKRKEMFVFTIVVTIFVWLLVVLWV